MSELFTAVEPAKFIASASQIRDGLRAYYKSGEWALAFEVGDSTGFSCKRHADCVAMSLWPSRGIAVHGIEIKVSKADLKKELEQPEKADAIGRYCDFWWVAAPKGLLDPCLLPIGWGLLEMGEKGIKVKKSARTIEAQTISRNFVAALFRAVTKEDDARLNRAVEERTAAIREEAKVEVARGLKRREEEIKDKWEGLQEILKKTGIPADSLTWKKKGFIDAVKKVASHEELPEWKLQGFITMVDRFAEQLHEMQARGKP